MFILIQNVQHLQNSIQLGKSYFSEFGVVLTIFVDSLLQVFAYLLAVLHRHLSIRLVHRLTLFVSCFLIVSVSLLRFYIFRRLNNQSCLI